MTIPDIGHCAGSGSEPARGTIEQAAEGASTGVCPACSGRFELHPSGVLSLHDAAEIDQREVDGGQRQQADQGGEIGSEQERGV